MDSQLGLIAVWNQGDWVTKAVALLLLTMSLASWIVIFIKALDIVKYKSLARRTEEFWHSADFANGVSELGAAQGNPFVQLANAGREATAHHRNAQTQLHDTLDISDWISRTLRNSIDDSTARFQSGLAVLASVGSTAPFVGLFGTVWGIYHALMGIGVSGQATLDQVAGPVGESLIMTALGLAVAIPAVLGYNALVRGNKFILTKLNRFAHDLHSYFVTGARVGNNPADGKIVTMKKASA
ncbi:MAG: MotA/TolQ/ExbB proton channel family protein [Rhodoferax sp.]|jgi:biopolymer transport protein ExbB